MDKEKKRLELTRRQFLKGALITGAAVGMGGANVLLRPGTANAAVFAQSPQLAKWVWPIRNLDILKRSVDNSVGIQTITPSAFGSWQELAFLPDPVFPSTTFYQVTAAEFTDQLHPALGPTTLVGLSGFH